jgi:hypothetical protein
MGHPGSHSTFEFAVAASMATGSVTNTALNKSPYDGGVGELCTLHVYTTPATNRFVRAYTAVFAGLRAGAIVALVSRLEKENTL